MLSVSRKRLLATVGLTEHCYEKLGFKSIGIRKNFYDCPRENALIMQMESIAGDE